MGYPDEYRGWYDVQGTGCCNDYCRWVGSSGTGGNPIVSQVSDTSFWSCAFAGTAENYSTRPNTDLDAYPNGWIFQKCDKQGDVSPLVLGKGTAELPFSYPETVKCSMAKAENWVAQGQYPNNVVAFAQCGKDCKAQGFEFFGSECPRKNDVTGKHEFTCKCSHMVYQDEYVTEDMCDRDTSMSDQTCDGPFQIGQYDLGSLGYTAIYNTQQTNPSVTMGTPEQYCCGLEKNAVQYHQDLFRCYKDASGSKSDYGGWLKMDGTDSNYKQMIGPNTC
jgi:hypothetical protein